SYHQDFHDITSGGNGTFNASVGYDEVTGIGTPIANNLVPALANVNQLVYTAPSGTNNFLLQVSGSELSVYDNNTLVASNPLAQTTSVAIAGAKNNSLTINMVGMPHDLAVMFDGGSGALAHTLTIQNGSFTDEAYTYAGTNSGTISLDGDTISFSRLTSTANTTTVSNLTFNLLPAALATLQAGSSPSNQITGTGVVTSSFANPTSALVINTAGGGSLVNLAAMGTSFKPATETFSGQATDSFQFRTASAVAATTSVDVETAILDLHGISPTFASLAGTGTVTDRVGTGSTLSVGSNDGSGTFSGIIKNGLGIVALKKVGNGTQALTGASTFTGACTVTAGVLQLD